jgi:hypothetical protein
MHLYTAKYIGLHLKNDFVFEEIYFLKIARLKDQRILVKRKDGGPAVIYKTVTELKSEWADLHKVGIIDH